MSSLERQKLVRSLAVRPSFILVGSIGLLIFSQLFSSFIFTVLPLSSLSDSVKTFINISSTGLAMMLILGLALKIYGGRISSLGLVKPSKPWLKRAVVSIFAYLIFSSLFLIVISLLFKDFDANQSQNVGIDGVLTISDKIAGFVAIVILTPVIEEVIFRGIIFRGLRTTSPFWLAAIVSSSLFALAHGQWNVALDTFVLGLVLAYLVEKIKSIAPGILIHALKNSLAFTLLFLVV
jgi:membrane protease YdiL (CAAX protease family)